MWDQSVLWLIVHATIELNESYELIQVFKVTPFEISYVSSSVFYVFYVGNVSVFLAIS